VISSRTHQLKWRLPAGNKPAGFVIPRMDGPEILALPSETQAFFAPESS
jgi:hypothetical protein